MIRVVVIFLNGPFGVGKTTVSRLLGRKLARVAIYDRELVGIVLQHLPAWLPIERMPPETFKTCLRGGS